MSRKAFIEKITEIAEGDPTVVLIVGDVGFSWMEPFMQKFPKQFLNIGICEQTMLNFAAGMAHMNYKPYVYTMSNFILSRPNEQLRNNICHSNSNVKLFGVKGSAAYAFLGSSHNLYGTEEIDYLKHLPNLQKYFPTTEEETKNSMELEYNRSGPAYFSI